MNRNRPTLQQFANLLKGRNALPKHMEVSRLGSVFLTGSFDTPPAHAISESVSSGMDTDADLAALKSLVEFVERRAFLRGKTAGEPLCQTDRSDGIAAMPLISTNKSLERARQNAYHEAVERYVWANWWDDAGVGHESSEILSRKHLPGEQILADLEKYVPIKQVYRIHPVFNDPALNVVIYFVFLNPIGVISGGACEPMGNSEVARLRALCELARHGLALKKILNDKIVPSTFYERRLFYFGATKEGEEQARSRLAANGKKAVQLPPLALDGAISHDFEDLVSVHRCLFENQPPFVGGALERLCL